MPIWLVVSNMNVIFHFIYGMSSFPLTNSYFLRWLLHHQPAMCGSNVLTFALRRASRQESADVSRLGPHWQQFRGPFFGDSTTTTSIGGMALPVWFQWSKLMGEHPQPAIARYHWNGWLEWVNHTSCSWGMALIPDLLDDSNNFPNFQEFRNLSHNFRFFRALCVKMCESKCSNVMVILDWSHCLKKTSREQWIGRVYVDHPRSNIHVDLSVLVDSIILYPIGSMVLLYMVTFTINIPPMLAYIPYMDTYYILHIALSGTCFGPPEV